MYSSQKTLCYIAALQYMRDHILKCEKDFKGVEIMTVVSTT